MIDIVGFTGTSEGMMNEQVLEVHMLLGEFKNIGVRKAVHGLCIGADEQFHTMARAFQYWMIGRPGVTKSGKVWKRSLVECDTVFPAKFFLKRNPDIVDSSGVMLATPKESNEMIGSGTWATIRYARKVQKPLILIRPDGSVTVEHVFGWQKWMNREMLVQLIATNEARHGAQQFQQYRDDSSFSRDPRS